jgi:hypothetical protein
MRTNDVIDIYQLLYCSVALRPMSAGEMQGLVLHAKQSNKQNGVTGVLMMHEGIFLGWLEGPKPAVRSLWQRLLADPRHHCIVELQHHEEVEHRAFRNWSVSQASHDDILSVVQEARMRIESGFYSPWGKAINALCALLETEAPASAVRRLHTRTQYSNSLYPSQFSSSSHAALH